MAVTYQNKLSLIPIEIKKEKKNYIVVAVEADEYFEMNEVCVNALLMIKEGRSLKHIEEDLEAKFPQEEIDILDFAVQLLELGIVEKIDDEQVPFTLEAVPPKPAGGMSILIGRALFHPVMRLLYLLLFLSNIFILLARPDLFPNYRDVFIFESMTLNVLVWIPLSLSLILFHELGHKFAANAFGLSSRFGIGHRLFLVVFETDLSQAWKLEPRERNVLYLAGICVDAFFLFAALAGQMAGIEAPVLNGILKLIAFDLALKLIYQCCFYMKTDLYYVIENITGCYNLMESSKQRLAGLFRKQKSVHYQEELPIIRLFSLFYLVGMAVSAALFIFYFLPQFLYSIKKSAPGLLQPAGSLSFWDSVLFLGQFLILFAMLAYSLGSKYRNEKKQL